MATAPARSTALLAHEANRGTNLEARAPPTAEPRPRPMNGLLALSDQPAGLMAVTALSTVLSRISGSTSVCFGHYLRDLCEDVAATFGGPSGPGLSCAAADAALPVGTAVTLRLVADVLITNAFVHAFPSGMPGWIAVSFTAHPEVWELAVEDGGIALRPHGDRRDNGLMIARLLVLRLDGRLEVQGVTAGTRCLVTVPRPEPTGLRIEKPTLPCSSRLVPPGDRVATGVARGSPTPKQSTTVSGRSCKGPTPTLCKEGTSSPSKVTR